MNDMPLKRLTQHKDLGVIFQENFYFTKHIETIASGSYKMLGFIKRITSSFNNIDAIKNLYNTLIRPKLEFAAVIWDPHTKKQKKIIERIQNIFLNYIFYKKHKRSPDFVHYEPIRLELEIKKLEYRRKCILLTFLYKLINNKINCAYLLSRINYRVPQLNTRPRNITFFVKNSQSRLDRICSLFNGKMDNTNCDVFNMTLKQFKYNLRSIDISD